MVDAIEPFNEKVNQIYNFNMKGKQLILEILKQTYPNDLRNI